MLYQEWNATGFNEAQVYELAAKIMLSLDKGYDIFNNNSPIWAVETNAGVYTYFPKKVYLYINSTLINTNLSVRFTMNAKIYELVKSMPGYDVGESYKTNQQHLMKMRKKVATFQDPLISIEYNLMFNDKNSTIDGMDNNEFYYVFINNYDDKPTGKIAAGDFKKSN